MEQTQVRPGQYFYTSWGYDQTNIDYLVVESVSAKSAVCRMAAPITLGGESQSDIITPGPAYGESFRMMIRDGWEGKANLRGSYPYCNGGKRLDTFRPTKVGELHYETNYLFGH